MLSWIGSDVGWSVVIHFILDLIKAMEFSLEDDDCGDLFITQTPNEILLVS